MAPTRLAYEPHGAIALRIASGSTSQSAKLCDMSLSLDDGAKFAAMLAAAADVAEADFTAEAQA